MNEKKAHIAIDKEIFFELFGLKYFRADIDVIEIVNNKKLIIHISGEDERIPEGDNDCLIQGSYFESKLIAIKE